MIDNELGMCKSSRSECFQVPTSSFSESWVPRACTAYKALKRREKQRLDEITFQRIKELQDIHRFIKDKQRSLLQTNEELKEASREGLEIASVRTLYITS